MSPTRRDVLKIASALGLVGALPPTTDERIAAIQFLDQEVSPRTVLDPAAFASEIDGMLGGRLDDDWLGAISLTEHAAYAQAREALAAMVTKHNDAGETRAFWQYEEAFFNLAMHGYYAGLRHGAAYENLRRVVTGDLVQCRDCWGVGATKYQDMCASCGGSGTVALRA